MATKPREAKKPVGIWIRVSTEDQAQGESPAHHERRARSYADAKGWEVVELYDLSGVSGKSVIEHPEAKRMLADVKAGRISGLVFSKLARLARNTRELLDFADLFRDAGADLISLGESIDTATPAGRLFYTMVAAMAAWEREEIAARTAASIPIRAKMGKNVGGAAPFGYVWKNGKLTIQPEQGPIRKQIYELFVKEKRLKRVARLLNEQGLRPIRGKAFTDSAIRRAIEDPTAKGWHRSNYTKSRGDGCSWDLKPESEWVWNSAPALVSEDLWTEANNLLLERRNGRRPARRTVHLFSGLTFCQCGKKMHVPSNSPKYMCRPCKNRIPCADLEAVFREQLTAFFVSPGDIAEALSQAHQSIKEKEELLGVLTRERERLQAEMDKLYQAFVGDEITGKVFGTRTAPLEERQKAVDEEIPALTGEIDFLKIQFLSRDEVIHEARDLYGRWDTLGSDAKREIVETVTERIVIGDGDIEIRLYFRPSPPPASSSSGGGSTPPRTPDGTPSPSSGTHGMKATQSCRRVAFMPLPVVVRKCPKPKDYPTEPKTLGEHLLKRRKELGIFRREVAAILGADTISVQNWETKNMRPRIDFYGRIIAFLGYDPEVPAHTIQDRMRAFRRRTGLTQRQAARRLGVNAKTWFSWENQWRRPLGIFRERLERLLSGEG